MNPPIAITDRMKYAVWCNLDQWVEPTGHLAHGGRVEMETGPAGIGQVDECQSQNTRQTFDSRAMVGIGDGCGEGPHGQHKVQGEGMAEVVQCMCKGGTTGRGQTEEG